MRIAELLGDELNTTRDYSGAKLQSDKRYRYDTQEKGFVEDAKGQIAADHIKILRLVSVKPLHIILQVGGMDEFLPDTLYVARQHAALQSVLK